MQKQSKGLRSVKMGIDFVLHMSGSTDNTMASNSTNNGIASRKHKGKGNAEKSVLRSRIQIKEAS